MNLADWTSPLANHLWQSTALVAAAWLLAFALKKNQARTRYWIWLIASLKFLVPFFLLIAVGRYIGSKIVAPVAHPALSSVMEQITQPFPQSQSIVYVAPAAAQHNVHLLPISLLYLWAIGSVTVALSWMRRRVQIRSAMRSASPWPLTACVPVLSIPSMLEPGVFGIFRPVLLLPEGIQERLTPAQMRAVVAHEMCHVRRRDNLTFALHMLVETLFWFHPLVWWIGARLIEERERACDEAVLQSGSEAEVYAEGILNVCKFYVESPLACVSGISGSDLKKRIVRIMTEHAALRLDFNRKLLLGVAGLLAIAVPVASGFARATQSHAESQATPPTPVKLLPMDPNADPSFEVATIKPSKLDDQRNAFLVHGNRYQIINQPLTRIICFAYDLQVKQVIGLPAWADTDKFDIDGKPDVEGAPSSKQWKIMLQKLLADRFKLTSHPDKRELSVYVLTVAKTGQKMTKNDSSPNGRPGWVFQDVGNVNVHNANMADVSALLEGAVLYRPVLDETGLTGRFDFTLKWTPDDAQFGGMGAKIPPPTDSATAPPNLFTAIQEQIGLKLDATKALADVMVVDHVEQPSPN